MDPFEEQTHGIVLAAREEAIKNLKTWDDSQMKSEESDSFAKTTLEQQTQREKDKFLLEITKNYPRNKNSNAKKIILPLFIPKKGKQLDPTKDIAMQKKQNARNLSLPGYIPALFSKCIPQEELTKKQIQRKAAILKDFHPQTPSQLRLLLSKLVVGNSATHRQKLSTSDLAFTATVLIDRVDRGAHTKREIQNLISDDAKTREDQLNEIEKEISQEKQETTFLPASKPTKDQKRTLLSKVLYQMIDTGTDRILDEVQLEPHPGFLVGVWCLDSLSSSSDTFSSSYGTDQTTSTQTNIFQRLEEQNQEAEQADDPSNLFFSDYRQRTQKQILKNFQDKNNINFFYYCHYLTCYTFEVQPKTGLPRKEYRWSICLDSKTLQEQLEDVENTTHSRLQRKEKKARDQSNDLKIKLILPSEFIYLNAIPNLVELAKTSKIPELPVVFEQLAHQMEDLYAQWEMFKEQTIKKLARLNRNFNRVKQKKGFLSEIDTLTSCMLLEQEALQDQVPEDEAKSRVARCLIEKFKRSPVVLRLADLQAMRQKSQYEKKEWLDEIPNLQDLLKLKAKNESIDLKDIYEIGKKLQSYSLPQQQISKV